MISPDVQANKNNKKYLINFYKKYLQTLKYHVKRARNFHSIFVGILSVLILSGNGKNPLSLKTAICRQSLTS